MNLNQEQVAFQETLKKCLGLTLNEVSYLEYDYSPEYPDPFYESTCNEINCVDYAIILQTDHKRIKFHIDGQFYTYGIGCQFDSKKYPKTKSSHGVGGVYVYGSIMYQVDIEMVTKHGVEWLVSTSSLWKKFIGHTITVVNLTWKQVKNNNSVEKFEKMTYPQHIKIDFSNGKSIFISVADFDQDDKEMIQGVDRIAVTDNEVLARKVKMIS